MHAPAAPWSLYTENVLTILILPHTNTHICPAYFEPVTPHRDITAVVTACAADTAATDESTIKVRTRTVLVLSLQCGPITTQSLLWLRAGHRGEDWGAAGQAAQPGAAHFPSLSGGARAAVGGSRCWIIRAGHSCFFRAVLCGQDPALRLAPAMQRFIYGVATADPTLSAV